jgi:hypothetical protein
MTISVLTFQIEGLSDTNTYVLHSITIYHHFHKKEIELTGEEGKRKKV